MFKFCIFVCFVLIFVRPGFGQMNSVNSLRADFDKLYGLDVILYNGRKYFPDSGPVSGQPFWRSKDSFTGDISISGKMYHNSLLQFNLYTQEFVLEYTNLNGQKSRIILNSESIDSVKFVDALFVPNKFPEIGQKFLQVIQEGEIQCFIGWYKEFSFKSGSLVSGFQYSDDLRTYYVVFHNQVKSFTGKSSFLRIFEGRKRTMIKKYISSRRISFKNLDENELRKLISYCENAIL